MRHEEIVARVRRSLSKILANRIDDGVRVHGDEWKQRWRHEWRCADRLPDVDPIMAMLAQHDQRVPFQSMRIGMVAETFDAANIAFHRGRGSWCHVMIAQCSEIASRALNRDQRLPQALVEMICLCAMWIEEIEARGTEGQSSG